MVDVMSSESSVSDEIDTSTESSPITVLTPGKGRLISTRGVYIFSDSSAGDVEAKYSNSGKILAKLYCSKFQGLTLPEVRIDGDVDEGIVITWSDVSVGSKIFYVIRYKEI